MTAMERQDVKSFLLKESLRSGCYCDISFRIDGMRRPLVSESFDQGPETGERNRDIMPL